MNPDLLLILPLFLILVLGYLLVPQVVKIWKWVRRRKSRKQDPGLQSLEDRNPEYFNSLSSSRDQDLTNTSRSVQAEIDRLHRVYDRETRPEAGHQNQEVLKEVWAKSKGPKYEVEIDWDDPDLDDKYEWDHKKKRYVEKNKP